MGSRPDCRTRSRVASSPRQTRSDSRSRGGLMRFRLLVLAGALGACLALTATAMATPQGPAGSLAVGKVTAIVPAPREPVGWDQPTTANWPVVGGNYLQQRYSALNQVSTANVTSLKE